MHVLVKILSIATATTSKSHAAVIRRHCEPETPTEPPKCPTTYSYSSVIWILIFHLVPNQNNRKLWKWNLFFVHFFPIARMCKSERVHGRTSDHLCAVCTATRARDYLSFYYCHYHYYFVPSFAISCNFRCATAAVDSFCISFAYRCTH